MSEAVTVPSVMVITSILSEESLARDTHRQTDGHTHIHHTGFCLVYRQVVG